MQVQMQLSQKQNTFSQVFAAFWKFILNFKSFEKKMTLIDFVFSKLRTPKTESDKCLKKCCFRGPLDKQHGKCAQAPLKSSSQHVYEIHWLLPSQLSRKRSLLLTCKILVLLVNTLAPNERYPVLNRDNLMIPIPMQLFQKQNSFSDFLAAFFKFRLNF